MQAFYGRHGGKNLGEQVPPEASPGGHGSGNGAETSNSHKNKPLIRALLFTLCNLGWGGTRLASHEQVNERRGQERDPSEEAGN